MTRKEYREKTRKFPPAETPVEAEYINEYTNIHHNNEYYNALIELEDTHTKMEENYYCVKDMKELDIEQNMVDDLDHKHARLIVLKCCLEQFKKEKQLTQKVEELKQKLKNDERKTRKYIPSNEKISSVEEVRSMLNDTLNLVLEMQENENK